MCEAKPVLHSVTDPRQTLVYPEQRPVVGSGYEHCLLVMSVAAICAVLQLAEDVARETGCL